MSYTLFGLSAADSMTFAVVPLGVLLWEPIVKEYSSPPNTCRAARRAG